VLHKITYGMEMGQQFEKRLLMHRNARRLDEDTNRHLMQLTQEQDLLGRFCASEYAQETSYGGSDR